MSARERQEDDVVGALRNTLANGMLPEEIVVVARSGAILSRYASVLLAEGLPNSRIDGKSPRGVGIQMATTHRAKGLEFRAVFIVGCAAEVRPQPYAGDDDDAAARTDHEERERRLLYVAMTRAREFLWISSAGQPSPFLARWVDASKEER